VVRDNENYNQIYNDQEQEIGKAMLLAEIGSVLIPNVWKSNFIMLPSPEGWILQMPLGRPPGVCEK
jgi:hypothetical protein